MSLKQEDDTLFQKNIYFWIMMTLQDIKSILSSHKSQLFKDYPIKSMAIFGSYSRMENNADSDLDILVEFKDKIGIRFIDLAEEIENIIGFKVDLVSKNGIKDKYLQSIDYDLIYV
ncbi:MAG: nucleotidyltransferase family protein [Bacteroidia bacterium]|nr:nucleotidyltransferase family protein [Bacteroidia bacterium]